jgi:dihydroorotase
MIRFVNARSAQGTYLSFTVDGAVFVDVWEHGEKLSRGSSDETWLPLREWLADPTRSWPRGTTFDAGGALILPAAIDAHVHSRSPGLEHKEDWHTLASGAYRGGVAAVADMPNTIPPTMTRAAVEQKAFVAQASGLDFRLFLGVGAPNINQVAELLSDPRLPLCGLKVFYGRTTGDLMYDDLETLARSLPQDGSKIIVFHSEDQCGVDHNHALHAHELERRDHAAFAVHSVIRSSETAHASTRTILEWARKSYRRPIHIAHVSTPVEVEMIAESKAAGCAVTCEVAPHHILLSTSDYERLGPLAKMNPPLRSPAEVEHLQRLVGKGAVDIFATDHAPHLLKEKETTVGKSPSGVPSIEFFYPLVFEVMRVTGLDLAQAVAMSTERPARLFGFEGRGRIAPGSKADFVVMGEDTLKVANQDVVSRCGWTPYDGWTLPRDVKATVVDGRLMYEGKKTTRGRSQGGPKL